MTDLVTYALSDGIATITMDDGKVNVLSPAMLSAVNGALDRAEADEAVVILTGRAGIFSGGFDLKVLRGGTVETADMLHAGFLLSLRLLSFPRPVLVACTGHAIAMGSFLLLSTDYRIGCLGEVRIQANEVAIGLLMPRAATEILRQRLTPAAFNTALVLAQPFTPTQAVAAGYLDEAVETSDLEASARTAAERFVTLDARAHLGSKLRARSAALAALKQGLEEDDRELRAGLAV